MKQRCPLYVFLYLYPTHNEVFGGILVSTPPVCLSLRPSVPRPSRVRPTSRVRFVASTVLLDLFHIYTSYQATSEGVSRAKFEILAILWNL